MAKKENNFSLKAPMFPPSKVEGSPYPSTWPSVEEFVKLGETEKSALYAARWAAVLHLISSAPPGCRSLEKEEGLRKVASGQVNKSCTSWAKAMVFFELLVSGWDSQETPVARTKKVEKKPVSVSGDIGKWKALMHYGRRSYEDFDAEKAVELAIDTGGPALAGYEKFADMYNDYMDYKASKLAMVTERCKYDDDGKGGLVGTDTAPKCKVDADCPPGHTCVGGAAIAALRAAQEGGLKGALESVASGEDDALGECAPGCRPPDFIAFFDDTASPKPDFFDVLDSLTKQPPPLSACITPHFENFFYVIPWQYWLMKNLENMVDSLLSDQIESLNEQIKNYSVCGTDAGLDLETIKAGAHLPTIGDAIDGLNIFPLPALPYMQWPPKGLPAILKLLLDPLNIIRVMILDMICWSICLVINPIIYSVLALMNEDLKNRLENYDEFSGTTATSLPSAANINMKKSDVNESVQDDILREAHNLGYVVLKNPKSAKGQTSINAGHQHIFELDKDGNGYAQEVCHPKSDHICHKHEVKRWVIQSQKSSCYPKCKQRFGHEGAPPHIHHIPKGAVNSQVRDYIRTVNYEDRITVKDLITLLAGDAPCRVKGVLIEIGMREENKSLDLQKANKILQFWKYLGNSVDMFAFIENSMLECEPDICPTPIDEELLNNLLKEMDKVCGLLKKPEDLLPLKPEDVEAMAISIGNKILQDSGNGDSKLDPDDNAAIVPEKTRLKQKLNERCQEMRRVTENDPAEGYVSGVFYEYFKKKVEDWPYQDLDKPKTEAISHSLKNYTALKWCGGTREGDIPPKKGTKKQKEADAPKCDDPNMNFADSKSTFAKPAAGQEQPCLYVLDDGKESSWNSNHVKKWKPDSATKYDNVVKSLDVWYGTDKELLYATIDSMTPVEKEWICRRNTWPGGPNRHDWSLMYNICDDLNWMEKETLAQRLGCKCQT
jgi:hypothetical protein